MDVSDYCFHLTERDAQHVHWQIGKHKGIETTNFLVLEHGMTLCRELAKECICCHMKQKRLLEVPMGPVSENQLVIVKIMSTLSDSVGKRWGLGKCERSRIE